MEDYFTFDPDLYGALNRSSNKIYDVNLVNKLHELYERLKEEEDDKELFINLEDLEEAINKSGIKPFEFKSVDCWGWSSEVNYTSSQLMYNILTNSTLYTYNDF